MEHSILTSEIESLLERFNLPVSDLAKNEHVTLFEALENSLLIGVIGIEVYEDTGLLRSLAVAEEQRDHGLGRRLIEHAEVWAARAGIQSLWLLTETAAGYFEKLGYESVPRSAAPKSFQLGFTYTHEV